MSETIPEDVRSAAKAAFHRARLLSVYDDQLDVIARAILQERERCAQIAAEWRAPYSPGTEARLLGHQEAARDIAAAIRSKP